MVFNIDYYELTHQNDNNETNDEAKQSRFITVGENFKRRKQKS